MKITLKPANENQPVRKPSLDQVVEKFINEKIQNAIALVKNNSDCTPHKVTKGPFKGSRVFGVNVEVPLEAYGQTKDFYKLCVDTLTPLGYHAEESHDGGGMYSTLYVTWKAS